jgi:hypothetical protein
MTKNKGGRPSKYKPEYCQEIEDFFDIEPYREVTDTYTYKDGTTKDTVKLLPNDIPFIRDFAKKIGVNVDTLYEWAKQHKEFSESLKAVKQLQEKILVINGLNGTYNSTFAIFTAKNVIGWRDKSEVDHTSGGERIEGFNFIRPNDTNDKTRAKAESGVGETTG